MAATTDTCTAFRLSPAAETDADKLRFIEEMTSNVDAVQERVLAEILGRNADSEYLAKCGLTGATNRAAFRAKVPVVTYEDLQPYIRRIADGDRSPVLTGPGCHPVSEFITSSGTSGGEPKLIPAVKDDHDRLLQLRGLLMAVMNHRRGGDGVNSTAVERYVPGHSQGKRLYFAFVKPETTASGGLPARFATTSYYKSDHFKDRRHDADHTSPVATILCEDTFQSMYAQMVSGLCQRHDVVRIGAPFASGLVRAIGFLRRHWEQLAADIEAGVLSPGIVTDPSVREAVAGILRRPDPELARFIRAECSGDNWAGAITRIWPNAMYLEAVVTGSMAQYVPTLNYYSGGLPVVSAVYLSSECLIGLNLRPMCDPSEVSYTVMPNMAYFEFLPVDATTAAGTTAAARLEQQLVDLAGVEAGREYEVVVTTHAGLNRYRVGDVLRVTGFHNAAPRFRFARRGNVLLSVDLDKVDEAELQRAVERAAAPLRSSHGAAVLDYTSRACAAGIPGHYVVYWELLLTTKKKSSSSTVDMSETLDRCCLAMEEAMNAVYRQHRALKTIGPLEIRVVRSGTFDELADHAVSGGASIGQHKVPSCVTGREAIIQLLDSRVVSSHFSPALPHWTPGLRYDSADNDVDDALRWIFR
ncbi:hypothetical protein ACP70R_047777 [Stipagrostis hirtigluma subsp. patula]